MSMWTSCLLLIMFMTTIPMVTSTDDLLLKVFAKSRLDDKENRMRWDALQAMPSPVKERHFYLFRLWEQYRNQSISKRPTMAKEILDAVTKIAYLDSRIDMIGFLLFGPRKGWPILRAVTYKNPGDSPGFEYMLKFFEEHCGVATDLGMNQFLANIYKYAIDKEAIHEAILLACSRHKTETYNIDVTNPQLNITPAPVHGTFEYCSRVSVNAATNHAKTYQIKVVPSKSIPYAWHSMIHICFHRNESMELCQCEKADWRSIQNGSWHSVMPSYDKRFLDVKFVARMSGDFVTVTLDEVSPTQRWHYGLLAGAIALLIMTSIILMISGRARILSLKKFWPHAPLGRAAAIMSCVLLLMGILILLMLRITYVSEPLFRSPWENSTRWEPLETIAHQIHIEDGLMIRVDEIYRYDLWKRYTSSSRSQRAEIVNEISESLKEVAFRDARRDMVGLILFGPEKGRLFLRVRGNKLPQLVGVVDYFECIRTIDDFYVKHCGPPCFNGLRRKHSTSNMCILATKEAIEEAVLLSCGKNVIEPVRKSETIALNAGEDEVNNSVVNIDLTACSDDDCVSPPSNRTKTEGKMVKTVPEFFKYSGTKIKLNWLHLFSRNRFEAEKRLGG